MMPLTKAAMLRHLRDNLPQVRILPSHVVRCGEFAGGREIVVDGVLRFAGGAPLIVRSSSTMEDTNETSNAGRFESVLDVAPERGAIESAIEAVLRSYGQPAPDDEVLIQPMLTDIKLSGVAFTRDMETYAEYYVINYAEGGSTDAVTGGISGGLKTVVTYKRGAEHAGDPDIAKLVAVMRDIEDFLGNSALDIEFAVTNGGEPVIFQVRPIAKGLKADYADVSLDAPLRGIYKKIDKLSKPHPFLLGRTTCFGVMPDWNPAEILGLRPKKLAVSLYKELITDSVWVAQRSGYGYRDLAMHPLMVSFCGVPYIDTRITFNSFVPGRLNVNIAEKLINFYLDKLKKFPRYHDKVEFEIVYSCCFPGIRERLKELLRHGFNENEITRVEFALLELTNGIIDPDSGLCRRDIAKAETLAVNYERIMRSDISLVDKIYWLIEECKAYGALPFAGAARAAFVAVQFLRAFVETGLMSAEEHDAYMSSLDTVSKRMNRDLAALRRGEIARDDFLSVYGHLRPGTYDIMSDRYDDAFDRYFGGGAGEPPAEPAPFTLPPDRMARMQRELDEHGLLVTVDGLFTFIKEAIEGREYVKFVFTKSLSMILRLIEELGRRVDIPKEDMAHLDISVVKALYSDLYAGNIKDIFAQNIDANRQQYETALRIKLPSLIVRPEDVYSFCLLDEEPNFITRKCVTAETATVAGDFGGKILFIQSADPGYDFVFSRGIAGLVTQFGGANSHMTIRCAELGIPAVIGVGEKNYAEWSRCARLTLDCQKKQVIRIN